MVPAGEVKSITTSKSSTTLFRSSVIATFSLPTPATSPASAPIRLLSGRSVAAPKISPWASVIACTSDLPILPAVPTTATRIIWLSPLYQAHFYLIKNPFLQRTSSRHPARWSSAGCASLLSPAWSHPARAADLFVYPSD